MPGKPMSPSDQIKKEELGQVPPVRALHVDGMCTRGDIAAKATIAALPAPPKPQAQPMDASTQKGVIAPGAKSVTDTRPENVEPRLMARAGARPDLRGVWRRSSPIPEVSLGTFVARRTDLGIGTLMALPGSPYLFLRAHACNAAWRVS